MRAVLVVGVCAAALVGTTASARAQRPADPRSIGLLSVDVAGDSTTGLRAQLEADVRRGIAGAGAVAVPRSGLAGPLARLKDRDGCMSASCLARLEQATHVGQFVRVHLSVTGNSYELELELVSSHAEGGLEGRIQRSCPVCSVADLQRAVVAAAGDLASGRFDPDPAASAVAAPPPAPPSPRADLVAAPAPPQVRPRRFGPWKWAAAGAAAAALVAGVALFALDGRGTCGDDQAMCPQVFDTGSAGLVGLGISVVAGGASAYMFVSDRRAER